MNRFRPAVFFFIAFTSLASARDGVQDSIVFRAEVERQFVDAMRFYEAGKYDSAAAMFARNIKEFPRSHRATGAYIMGGKAYYLIGSYRESIKFLKDLMDLYPESQYVDDAHYSLGLVYYRMGRYEDAASEFLMVRELSQEPRLQTRSDRMLDVISSSNLSIAQLQLLLGETKRDEMKALFNFRIAEKILRLGDVRAAIDLLRDITKLPVSIKYVGEAKGLLDRTEKGGVLKIGVVLPLLLKLEKPSVREVGFEFLEGMKFAVDEYNQDAVTKVNLEVRDTERDPSIAARQVTELCSDEKVVAILGPISSNEVFASAGIANAKGVPIITPTGTSNGIAGLGPYVFQANPDYDVRGRAMAVYAYDQLRARRFTVLAPIDAVGKLLAESFIDEIKKLGGEMIDVQWYQSGSNDLRTQLMTMRQRALEKTEVPFIDFSGKIKQSELNTIVLAGVNQRVLDSLVERGDSASVEFLFGKDGKRIADSLKLPTQLIKLKYDSLGLAVQNIDAIFLPIASSEEIAVVSSQLKFSNVQGQFLGTGDWNDLAELDQNRQYVEGVVFSTDSYYDVNDRGFKTFAVKFQKANNGKKPGANTLFGYDVMRMTLQVVSRGAINRNELAAAMAKVQDFVGQHTRISFSESRVNSFLTILQYKNRSIKKIGEVDLSRRPTQPAGN